MNSQPAIRIIQSGGFGPLSPPKRKVTDKMTNYIVTRNGVRVEYRAKNRMELDKQLESFTKLLPNSPPVESIVEGKLPHRRELATGATGRKFGARWVENPLASLGRKGGEA